MKKLTKGILYTGGLIGSFIAGAYAIAACMVFVHHNPGEGCMVAEDEHFKTTVIGFRDPEGTVFPAIVEAKKNQ